MDIQSIQMQHRAIPAVKLEHPCDLTWLGLADDRELLFRAREIASQNENTSQAARVFEGMAAKLHSWRFAEG